MSKKKDTESNKWQQFSEDQADDFAMDADDEVFEDSPVGVGATSGSEGLELTSREDLEKQLNALEAEAQLYKDKLVRSQAELQNIQRRAERDVTNAHRYGVEKLLKELLPVIDSLQRALETSTADHSPESTKGIELTRDLLIKTLGKFGVKEIDPAVGETFNPEQHEAMSMQPNPEAESNSILQVLQKGYDLNGRVLRAAMVIVAQ